MANVKTNPKIISGKDIKNKIHKNSKALKKIMVKIPKRITKIPPKICHLKAIQTKINKTIQGKAFGIFLNNPLVSAPDNKAKISQPTANTSNKLLAKMARYMHIFCLSIPDSENSTY